MIAAVGRCPDCGRDTRTCWIMPCLGLEQAMTSSPRFRAWVRKAGLPMPSPAKIASVVAAAKDR